MEYEKENKIISIFHDIIIKAHLESFLKDSKKIQLLVVKYGLEVLRARHMGSMIQSYEKAKGQYIS